MVKLLGIFLYLILPEKPLPQKLYLNLFRTWNKLNYKQLSFLNF